MHEQLLAQHLTRPSRVKLSLLPSGSWRLTSTLRASGAPAVSASTRNHRACVHSRFGFFPGFIQIVICRQNALNSSG